MLKNKRYKVQLTTLTPIHIGNGDELVRGFDFVNIREELKVINKRAMMIYYAEQTNELCKAIENNKLEEFLKDAPELIFDKRFRIEEKHTSKIKLFIRDGQGRLYIPGSSLKGAIRTAVISTLCKGKDKLIDSVLKKVKPKEADKKLLSVLLGDDPKKDLMKILQVRDSEPFEKSIIKKMVLTGSNKNLNSYEVIPIGETTEFVVTIDSFFLNNRIQAGIPDCKNFEWEKLFACIFNHSADIINSFIDLSEKGCGDTDSYSNIADKFNDLEQNETIMCLGAGISWIGITGNLIGKQVNENKELRNRLKLAQHRLNFDFPKTRRFIKDNISMQPLGWVKLKFEEIK